MLEVKMVFEGLNEKLQNTFNKLKKKGKLSEKDIKEATREIKLALLEADVNFKVVKVFIKRINERALGQEVMKSLTPGQQVIKIVNEEMIDLLGEKTVDINTSSQTTVLMMVGLQGAGKTTTSGKLANLLRKNKGASPLLVACDVYRPAAIKQLKILGEELDIPVYADENEKNPVNIASEAVKVAKKNQNNLVIVDTAGRLQIDDLLMKELEDIKAVISPDEILLTVDAMTGQEAVNVAEKFNEKLDLSGLILTKLDGDTRGGAALSITYVTGKHIKYIGTGEKLSDIEQFHPDRMASRILGMGDVLTLIEQAQSTIDEEKAIEMQKKMFNQQFTLDDFLEQIEQIQSMGSINQLMSMMPGMNSSKLKGLNLSDTEIKRNKALIQSMTPKERANPSIINASRKKRIAQGSGTRVQDVNKLLKGFTQSKKMMKQLSGNKGFMKKGKMNFPF
jgi:signal recognition particle subunit SRP54